MYTCNLEFWKDNSHAKATWDKFAADYEFTDGVPKAFLHVKLNPDISEYNRGYVVNGIRSYASVKDLVLSKQEVEDSLKSLNAVFNIIIAIVASIALFIMFYLLLISMTQNINDAIWEYGVLRSMGLTRAEGRRVYLYEAYAVVIGASIMGTLVGFSASLLVSAQIFTFIEMPPIIIFPLYTFLGMTIIAIITTYVSVYLPIKRVNQKQIAAVLKQGA